MTDERVYEADKTRYTFERREGLTWRLVAVFESPRAHPQYALEDWLNEQENAKPGPYRVLFRVGGWPERSYAEEFMVNERREWDVSPMPEVDELEPDAIELWNTPIPDLADAE